MIHACRPVHNIKQYNIVSSLRHIIVHWKLSTSFSAVDLVWPQLGTAALEATRLWAALSLFRFTVTAAAQLDQVPCRVAQLWEHTFRA